MRFSPVSCHFARLRTKCLPQHPALKPSQLTVFNSL
jgi:hypothetical protein